VTLSVSVGLVGQLATCDTVCLSVSVYRFGWLGLNQDIPPHPALNYVGVVLCLIRYQSVSLGIV